MSKRRLWEYWSGTFQIPFGRLAIDGNRIREYAEKPALTVQIDTARDNELYNAAVLDGINHWDQRDLASLDAIHITDFDVVALGRVRRVPGR